MLASLVLAVFIGYFSLANGKGNPQTVSVSNPCHPNPCALNQECIAVPGACMDPPCALMATCQDTGPDPCASNPCPPDRKCLPAHKHCFTTPCPQYRCKKNARDCGVNETISNCGALCEPNCHDRGPKPCPMICLPPACQCKQGYARSAGKCLLQTDCPKQTCPPNERMDSCGNHCEGTCDNKFPMCILICGPPACVCMPGYYRQDGVCVPETQCPEQSCPPNEILNTCGNLCEGTCDNKFPACIEICAPPACVCDKGYYRQDGVCVPETQCQETSCPPNEKINSCGNHCEPSCENKGLAPCMAICAEPACECESGYYRQDGICVPEDQCQETSCPPNEKMHSCGNLCEATCENWINGLAPSCICGQPACACVDGYFRQDGVCVPEDQCRDQSCPPNERMNSCGNHCEPTCETKGQFAPCMAICGPPACECERGYYRQDGVCVPEHECKGVKPGLCPMIDMVATACRDDCLKDEDCSGEMKCCGQCVKQCLTPLILIDSPPIPDDSQPILVDSPPIPDDSPPPLG